MPNPGVYICDTCGKEAFWGPGWLHYSSLKDIEDDAASIPTYCSTKCALGSPYATPAMKKTLLAASTPASEAEQQKGGA